MISFIIQATSIAGLIKWASSYSERSQVKMVQQQQQYTNEDCIRIGQGLGHASDSTEACRHSTNNGIKQYIFLLNFCAVRSQLQIQSNCKGHSALCEREKRGVGDSGKIFFVSARSESQVFSKKFFQDKFAESFLLLFFLLGFVLRCVLEHLRARHLTYVS